MNPIPLSTVADQSQVEALRPFVEGRSCVVVGSAPLSTRYAAVQPYETTIAVNGGISSLPNIADVFVLNSKAQDEAFNMMTPRHRLMLKQAKNKRAGHVVLLRGPKIASERFTLAALKPIGCEYSTWSVLDKPTKGFIEHAVCARPRPDDKEPCSSGLLAVALVLSCGAISVRVIGFSFRPGYQYDSTESYRGHVHADRRALVALRERFGPRLHICGCLLKKVAA